MRDLGNFLQPSDDEFEFDYYSAAARGKLGGSSDNGPSAAASSSPPLSPASPTAAAAPAAPALLLSEDEGRDSVVLNQLLEGGAGDEVDDEYRYISDRFQRRRGRNFEQRLSATATTTFRATTRSILVTVEPPSSDDDDDDDDEKYDSTDDEEERGRSFYRRMAGSPPKALVSKFKVEKSAKDEDPAAKEARREERRKRREERDQKAADATPDALKVLRTRSKGKAKEKESSPEQKEKKPRLTTAEALTGLARRSPSVNRVEAVKQTEVRVKSTPEKGSTSLKTNKDSSSPSKGAKTKPPHHHHPHDDHSTPEARAQCRRCQRKVRKKGEEEEKPGEKHEDEQKNDPKNNPKLAEKKVLEPSQHIIKSPEQDKKQKAVLGFVIDRKPEKLIKCVTCLADDIPYRVAAKLSCGHYFCHECLKRIFTLSLTDPAHMPPKCCGNDHIPLKHVEKLLTYQTKKLWNKKYLEYTTANRIYCPTTDCGEWIQPKDINGKIGRCSRCRTKVCAMCNGKDHGGGDCPKDEDFQKFIEAAKKSKYQRCYSCRAMVELDKGCNHMTCRCTAEFCYVCGDKWKTCDCPWFNYDAEDDEYAVPLWNDNDPAPEIPPEILIRRERRARARAQQMRDDEELARRLAREMNDSGGTPGTHDEPAGAYQLPNLQQIDPLAALGRIGNGLTNGIRRLAADYAEATRIEPRLERRATEPASGAAALRRQRSRERARASFDNVPLDHAQENLPFRPRVARGGTARTRSNRTHRRGLEREPVIPRSRYLSRTQQAHIEGYLRGLEPPNPEIEAELELDRTADISSSSPPSSPAVRTRTLRMQSPLLENNPPANTIDDALPSPPPPPPPPPRPIQNHEPSPPLPTRLRRSNTDRTVRRGGAGTGGFFNNFASEYASFSPFGNNIARSDSFGARNVRRNSLAEQGLDYLRHHQQQAGTGKRTRGEKRG